MRERNIKIFRNAYLKSKFLCKECSEKERREKIEKTNIEKFGFKSHSQNPNFKEKMKGVFMEKFGVEHNSQSQLIKDKKKETTFNHFGVEYPGQSLEVKEKAKLTNLEKYGVENPSQNIEISQKFQNNAKFFKEYKMPSGIIRKVQGYEPFALDILLKEFTEEQIITERKQIPRIEYLDNKKKRYYFPDIFIPHLNKIIEVKSTWTYKCKEDNIFLKEKATKEHGYNYEFWIFDNKGKKLTEEELLFI